MASRTAQSTAVSRLAPEGAKAPQRVIQAVPGTDAGGRPDITITDVRQVEASVGSDPSFLSFEVVLSQAATSTITIEWRTVAVGSADATDLSTPSYPGGTLTILAGQSSGFVSPRIDGDTNVEVDEFLLVELYNPVGADFAGGAQRLYATGMIQDDDGGGEKRALLVSGAELVESDVGSQLATFKVQLSRAAAGELRFDYRTIAGSATAGVDFTATSGVLTFPAGQTEAFVTVPVLGDNLAEAEESFTLLVTPQAASAASVTSGSTGIAGLGLVSDDDSGSGTLPVLSVRDVRQVEATSGGDPSFLEFEVVLSQPAASTITLEWRALAAGSADSTDLSNGSFPGGTLTFLAGQSTAFIAPRIDGEGTSEVDEFLLVELYNPAGAAFAGNAQRLFATGIIQDDDGIAAKRTLLVSGAERVETDAGSQQAVFKVQLSRPATTELVFDFRTIDGSAAAGLDYTATTGAITFAAGQTEAFVSVPVLGDNLAEAEESFTLLVTPQAAAVASVTSGTTGIAGLGLISDDDSGSGALPVLSVRDVRQVEASGGGDPTFLEFEVVLSQPAASTISVGWRSLAASADTTDLSNGSFSSGTLTFLAGQSSAFIFPRVDGDAVSEFDEALLIELYNPAGAAFAGNARRLFATGIIQDDDGIATKRTLLVSGAERVETDAGSQQAVFKVQLSRPATTELKFDFRTIDGSAAAGVDFTATSGVLTFAAGQTEAFVSVPVLGDNLAEAEESFTLLVTPQAAAVASVTGGTSGVAGLGLISDDDSGSGALPVLSVRDVRQLEANTGADPNYLEFEIVLSQPAASAVSVGWRSLAGSADSSDLSSGSFDSSTLTFSAGQSTAFVYVRIDGDTGSEFDEFALFELFNPAGAAFAGNAQRLFATGVIQDDDGVANKRALLVSGAELVETDAGSRQAVFKVQLSRPAATDLAFDFGTIDGSATAGLDYTATSGVLSFAAGQSEAFVSVPVLGDNLAEAEESFTLLVAPQAAAVASVTSGASGVAGLGLISDDDAGNGLVPVMSVRDVRQVESNTGNDPNYLEFEIVLSQPAASAVSVGWRSLAGSADSTDLASGNFNSGTVDFTAGQSSAHVYVRIDGDVTAEFDEVALLELFNPAGAAFAGNAQRLFATGVIQDDDGIANKRSLLVSNAELVETDADSREAVFKVQLSRPASSDLSFDFQTLNGSATAGLDYTAASGALHFAAGQSEAFVSVPVLGDNLAEAEESFSLLVTPQPGSVASVTSGANAIAGLGLISDDDSGNGLVPVLSVRNARQLEASTGADPNFLEFEIVLNQPAAANSRVDWRVLAGTATASDLSSPFLPSGTLDLVAGQTSAFVVVRIDGDVVAEADESLVLELSNPVGLAFAGNTARLTATGVIVDDDSIASKPSVIGTPTSAVEGDGAVPQAVFVITLSRPATQNLTLDFHTVDGTAVAGSDYVATQGQVSFVPGQVTASLSVALIDDGTIEPDETFSLELDVTTDFGGGPRVESLTATIVNDDFPVASPTLLADTIVGSGADDSIDGLAGNDSLSGRAGNDTLIGGPGIDTLVGGPGNDVFGVDVLADLVVESLNEGTDLVNVGLAVAGTYTLPAHVENATVTSGATVAVALVGNDLPNLLTGNGAANALTGGGGNDTLVGGTGVDALAGGAGDDLYVVDVATDAVNETAVGSDGTDTVSIAFGATGTFVLPAGVENASIASAAALAVHATGNALANTLTGHAGNNSLAGLEGPDTLDGGAGQDTLLGGAGNDSLVAGDGNDSLVGEAGDDALDARGAGNDTADGGEGTDTLWLAGALASYAVTRPSAADTVLTGAGQAITLRGVERVQFSDGLKTLADLWGNLPSAFDDNLTGTAGAESIDGLAGNDTLTGLGGHDTLVGGPGIDSLVGGPGDDVYGVDALADAVVEALGEGTDLVNVGLAVAGVYALPANVERATVTSAATVAVGLTGNDLPNLLTGNGAANALTGGGGNDTLVGGAGVDAMAGGAGDDLYVVDVAADTVNETAVGSDGIDAVSIAFAAAGTYVLPAGVERAAIASANALLVHATGNALANLLVGSGGNNSLSGLDGDDSMDGGLGNDTLLGGLGDDTLLGGDGNDSLVADAGDDLLDARGSGNDTADGGAGTDTLVLPGAAALYATTRPSAADTVLTGGGQVVTLRGVERVQFSDVLKSIGDLWGNLPSAFDDSVTGTAGAESIDGLAGNDTLTGLGGHDTLVGGPGIDSLVGGPGDDVYGVDALADAVVEAPGEGTDLVNVGLAVAGVYALPANVERATVTSAATVAVGLTGNDLPNLLTGNGAANALTGGGGNDTLVGGAGVDAMAGGAGDDLYVVDVATDAVNETAVGSDGTDTVTVALALAGTYVLPAGVERAVVTSAAGLLVHATGNALANLLIGSGGNNSLSGLDGDDSLDGGLGNDTLLGGVGHDTLLAGDGNDSLLGDAGDDLLDARGGGNDTADGGVGTDTLVLPGAAGVYAVTRPTATDTVLTGGGQAFTLRNVEAVQFSDGLKTMGDLWGNATSPLADSITGTAGAESIDGLAGNDTLTGLGGHDTLVGGAGVDSLVGGPGDDVYGVDVLADVVVEALGEGTDLVNVGLAAAGVYALPANVERATVTSAATVAVGLLGNDLPNLLTGNGAANALTGNGGNDTLVGGAGVDAMAGGAGDDLYVVDVAADVVNETAAGSDGTDMVSVAFVAAGTYTLPAGVENASVASAPPLAVGLTGNALANLLTGSAGNNSLSGLDGDDTLRPIAGADSVDGGLGNDTLWLEGAATDYALARPSATQTLFTGATGTVLASNVESVRFGAAAPVLLSGLVGTLGSPGADTLVGGALGDTLDGAAGNDSLDGAAGADTLQGGAGNDSLAGGPGADILDGGEGSDTYAFAAGGGFDVIEQNDPVPLSQDALVLGAGILPADVTVSRGYFSFDDLVVNINGAAGLEQVVVVGFFAGDAIAAGTLDQLRFAASPVVFTQAQLAALANAFDGGNHVFVGLPGNDTLTGDFAGAADDWILGGAGLDSLSGLDGADTLYGGAGSDTLLGGAGADHLAGGDAGDALEGGAGNDTVSGGAGSDRYVFGIGSGQDTILEALAPATWTGALDSGAGPAYAVGDGDLPRTGDVDVLSLLSGVTTANLRPARVGDALVLRIDGTADQVTIVDYFARGTPTVERILFPNGAIWSDAVVRTMLLRPTAGNDTLVGYLGADNLSGGTGNDVLDGREGNDVLDGGAGADTLTGGAGSDRFVFNTANALVTADTVTDFAPGVDTVVLAASVFPSLAGLVGTRLDPDTSPLVDYSAATGALSVDADGAGPGAPVVIALLGVASHPPGLGLDVLVSAG